LQLTASRARSFLFDTLVVARSRQLNGNPLGGWAAWLASRFDADEAVAIRDARGARPVVPWPVVPAWYAGAWCSLPVVLGVIMC
jgi:hypothetical protein